MRYKKTIRRSKQQKQSQIKLIQTCIMAVQLVKNQSGHKRPDI